jgi:large subunit ribosomal protein L32
MAVPRMHHTRSRRNKSRMHLFLNPAHLISCKKCGKKVRPHTVCQNCGYYKGREVVDVLKKLSKKERKQRQREIKQRERENEEKKSSF